ncbi:MAG: hypothetical protein K2G36_05290 [Ruminococcus sp.]|nr:hypothetical protein [Ruminococcus sp.]
MSKKFRKRIMALVATAAMALSATAVMPYSLGASAATTLTETDKNAQKKLAEKFEVKTEWTWDVNGSKETFKKESAEVTVGENTYATFELRNTFLAPGLNAAGQPLLKLNEDGTVMVKSLTAKDTPSTGEGEDNNDNTNQGNGDNNNGGGTGNNDNDDNNAKTTPTFAEIESAKTVTISGTKFTYYKANTPLTCGSTTTTTTDLLCGLVNNNNNNNNTAKYYKIDDTKLDQFTKDTSGNISAIEGFDLETLDSFEEAITNEDIETTHTEDTPCETCGYEKSNPTEEEDNLSLGDAGVGEYAVNDGEESEKIYFVYLLASEKSNLKYTCLDINTADGTMSEADSKELEGTKYVAVRSDKDGNPYLKLNDTKDAPAVTANRNLEIFRLKTESTTNEGKKMTFVAMKDSNCKTLGYKAHFTSTVKDSTGKDVTEYYDAAQFDIVNGNLAGINGSTPEPIGKDELAINFTPHKFDGNDPIKGCTLQVTDADGIKVTCGEKYADVAAAEKALTEAQTALEGLKDKVYDDDIDYAKAEYNDALKEVEDARAEIKKFDDAEDARVKLAEANSNVKKQEARITTLKENQNKMNAALYGNGDRTNLVDSTGETMTNPNNTQLTEELKNFDTVITGAQNYLDNTLTPALKTAQDNYDGLKANVPSDSVLDNSRDIVTKSAERLTRLSAAVSNAISKQATDRENVAKKEAEITQIQKAINDFRGVASAEVVGMSLTINTGDTKMLANVYIIGNTKDISIAESTETSTKTITVDGAEMTATIYTIPVTPDNYNKTFIIRNSGQRYDDVSVETYLDKAEATLGAGKEATLAKALGEYCKAAQTYLNTAKTGEEIFEVKDRPSTRTAKYIGTNVKFNTNGQAYVEAYDYYNQKPNDPTPDYVKYRTLGEENDKNADGTDKGGVKYSLGSLSRARVHNSVTVAQYIEKLKEVDEEAAKMGQALLDYDKAVYDYNTAT